ncbi:MAG: protein kinase, partial [Pseudomonadota bacterium]
MHRLDLLNLKPDSLEVKLLLELLKKEKRPGVDHSGSVLKKNSTYKIEFKVKEYSIQLSHTLIFRARNKPTKSGFRCDIINDKLLGKGGYGELYPILKTFSVNEEFSLIGWKNTPKERVVKIQLGHPMNEESTILQSVPHIHAKRVIVYESQRENYCSEKKQHCSIVRNESYIVMKKLPGKELSSLKLESFTIEQKIQLFLKVLLALKNQVHDLDLVHKDINSDNILVEFCEKTEIFTVNIIDYGLAKKIEKGEQYNITVHPIEPPINYGTPTQDRQEYDILCLTGFSERLFCI